MLQKSYSHITSYIVLWECTEYNGIRDEFIRNLDGILQNEIHLKSSFDKTKIDTYLIRVFGNVMVISVIGFSKC